MRSERKPRRSTRRPEALASRQHAILALGHCGPTDKPLECLDHRSKCVRNALSVMTREIGDAARHEVGRLSLRIWWEEKSHLERILRTTGLSAFDSNLGMQHASGSEYGRGHLVFSSAIAFSFTDAVTGSTEHSDRLRHNASAVHQGSRPCLQGESIWATSKSTSMKSTAFRLACEPAGLARCVPGCRRPFRQLFGGAESGAFFAGTRVEVHKWSVDGVFMWTIHCERDDFASQVDVRLFRLNHNLRILGSAILALNVLYVWSRLSLLRVQAINKNSRNKQHQ